MLRNFYQFVRFYGQIDGYRHFTNPPGSLYMKNAGGCDSPVCIWSLFSKSRHKSCQPQPKHAIKNKNKKKLKLLLSQILSGANVYKI